MEKTAKHPSIFVAKVNNFLSVSKLLKEVVADEYEVKIMDEQIKI